MPSSSNRPSRIPSSFDRFRVPSIQFLSPFRSHQCERHSRPSPERSWLHKTQVHPYHNNSSEFKSSERENADLFHVNNQSDIRTSALSRHPSTKKSSNNLFITRPTSNALSVVDLDKALGTNKSRLSERKSQDSVYSPTPCMLRYRNTSLTTIIPTRIIKYPKALNNSFDQVHSDQFSD